MTLVGYDPTTFHDERQLMTPIFRTSAAFRAFIHAERAKITAPVLWRVQPLAMSAEGNCASVAQPGSGARVFIITLDHLPATEGDAITCAHEMMHAVLNLEGFPRMGPTSAAPLLRQSDMVGTLIYNLLEDVVIAERLRPYGFDQRAHLDAERAEAQANLRKLANKAPNPIMKLMLALESAGTYLEYQATTGDTLPFDWHPYVKRWSSVAAEFRRVLAFAQASGWGTPSRHRDFCQQIIQHYRMGAYVRLLED